MIVTFSVGSKCAVMLPRKFLNPQLTPAKGLIVNHLVDSRSLVLIEEVWQFNGFSDAPLSEMCMSTGRVRSNCWGWQEIPKVLDDDEYIILPVNSHNLMEPSISMVEAMIRKSVADFKRVHGFV